MWQWGGPAAESPGQEARRGSQPACDRFGFRGTWLYLKTMGTRAPWPEYFEHLRRVIFKALRARFASFTFRGKKPIGSMLSCFLVAHLITFTIFDITVKSRNPELIHTLRRCEYVEVNHSGSRLPIKQNADLHNWHTASLRFVSIDARECTQIDENTFNTLQIF